MNTRLGLTAKRRGGHVCSGDERAVIKATRVAADLRTRVGAFRLTDPRKKSPSKLYDGRRTFFCRSDYDDAIPANAKLAHRQQAPSSR